MVTFQQLRGADLGSIQDQIDTWKYVERALAALQTNAKYVGDGIACGAWEGSSAVAAAGRLTYLRNELDDAETEVAEVKGVLSRSMGEFLDQQKRLDRIVTAVAEDPRLTINESGTVKAEVKTIVRNSGSLSFMDLIHAQMAADDHNDNIKAILGLVSLLDTEVSGKLRAAVNLDRPEDMGFNGEAAEDIAAADFNAPTDPRIAGAQAAAFEATIGRQPVSESDWKLAAALDPTSRMDKNNDNDAVVAVGRITPRPGEGLVRIALYIPAEEAFNLPRVEGGNVSSFDLGDNRGMDPQFNPEDTRVTMYVDYETGTVVARQNPSVDSNGVVRVDTPSVMVSESTNGAVRLQYDATNAFAPPEPGDSHHVRGDVVVTPGADPRIDGTISDFPSFEAYHDGGDGSTTTLVQDRADNESVFGPLFELPTSHDIGMGDDATAQFKSWRNISGDDWLLDGERMGTPLGDPANPPKLDPYPPYGGTEYHPTVPGVGPGDEELM